MKLHIWLAVISIVACGCTTSLKNRPHFSEHVSEDHRLMEVMYLGRVNPNVPEGTLHIAYDIDNLYLLFSQNWIPFMIENGVILDEPEKIDIGTPMSVQKIDKYNWFEGTTIYVGGRIYSPEQKVRVPYQLNIQSRIRVVRDCTEKVSKFGRILGAKEKRYFKKYLDRLPWETDSTTVDRIIDEYSLTY